MSTLISLLFYISFISLTFWFREVLVFRISQMPIEEKIMNMGKNTYNCKNLKKNFKNCRNTLIILKQIVFILNQMHRVEILLQKEIYCQFYQHFAPKYQLAQQQLIRDHLISCNINNFQSPYQLSHLQSKDLAYPVLQAPW